MEDTIKVLHISHDLEFGGLQQVVVNLSRNMDKNKYSLSVLSLAEDGPLRPALEKEGIPVVSLNIRAPDYLTFAKISRHLSSQRWDIIHTHNTQPFIEGGLGCFLTIPNVPLIHTDHSRIFPFKKRYMLAERVMSYHAKKVVAVSQSTADDLVDKVGIPRRKITVIHNGVDTEKFANASRDDGLLQRPMANEKIVGVVGRLVKGKGIQYLIEAVSVLLAGRMNVRLVVVGDGEYRKELINLATELGILNQISFVGSRTDVEKFYKIFHVFVLPSLSEGLPVVVLEAMAAGCPVVLTDVGGAREIVRDSFSGLIVPPQSTESLSHAIRSILTSVGMAETLSNNGLEIVRSKFSLDAMSQAYAELYNNYVS